MGLGVKRDTSPGLFLSATMESPQSPGKGGPIGTKDFLMFYNQNT